MVFSISNLFIDLWFESNLHFGLGVGGGNKAVYSVFFFPICLFSVFPSFSAFVCYFFLLTLYFCV